MFRFCPKVEIWLKMQLTGLHLKQSTKPEKKLDLIRYIEVFKTLCLNYLKYFRTMKNLILISTLLFFILQSFEKPTISAQEKSGLVFEKLYLHVDRELYSPGDDIWFKSYLVNGLNTQLIPGYKNIYAELLSESGDLVQHRLFLSQDGTGKGDFSIPENISEGTYIIRAYTKYQQNFGEESYFHKKIFISGLGSSASRSTKNTEISVSEIDVSFLPEGGYLVANAPNRIAFKAIDESGKGIPVKGKVVDENGAEIVAFQTRFRGMGTFEFTPQKGKNYSVKLENHPNYSYQFEAAKPNGIGLRFEKMDDNLLFTISQNSENANTRELTFKVFHKDMLVFSNQISLSENQAKQAVLENFLPVGISKVGIFDHQNNILAERLVFVCDKKEKTIQFKLNKSDYSTREKVELEIAPLLARRDSVNEALSVAVVNADYFNSQGGNQSIQSYLLLDSELKGSIESPASYFIDEENISADEKLDLVMMVNGWRKYYWEELEQFMNADLPNWEDLGLTLNGSVVSLNRKNPVAEGDVILSPFVGGVQFETTTTDEAGNFTFEGLLLKDSAMVILDAKTKKGSKKTEILVNQPPVFDNKFDPTKLQSVPLDNIPGGFFSEEFSRLNAQKQYNIGAETIILEDIQIKGQRKLNDGHFRLYGEPDISYQVIDEDQHFIDIFDYIETKSPGGVLITTDDSGNRTIRIRMGKQAPLLLIDGVQTDWEMINVISMNDIDKIEILKTGFAMAAFGSRGGDGVISIFTKVGEKSYEFERDIAGRATPYVSGFNQPGVFYSPKYTLETKDDPKPDLRPTLLWAPDVKIENGVGKLEFFTADKTANYVINVEGISNKGRICYGTQVLTVFGE